MSILICEDCDRPVNSDDDPGCIVDTGNMRWLHTEIVVCERCREKRWERNQERLMEDGPGPGLLEQQQAAMTFK